MGAGGAPRSDRAGCRRAADRVVLRRRTGPGSSRSAKPTQQPTRGVDEREPNRLPGQLPRDATRPPRRPDGPPECGRGAPLAQSAVDCRDAASRGRHFDVGALSRAGSSAHGCLARLRRPLAGAQRRVTAVCAPRRSMVFASSSCGGRRVMPRRPRFAFALQRARRIAPAGTVSALPGAGAFGLRLRWSTSFPNRGPGLTCLWGRRRSTTSVLKPAKDAACVDQWDNPRLLDISIASGCEAQRALLLARSSFTQAAPAARGASVRARPNRFVPFAASLATLTPPVSSRRSAVGRVRNQLAGDARTTEGKPVCWAYDRPRLSAASRDIHQSAAAMPRLNRVLPGASGQAIRSPLRSGSLIAKHV